MKCIAILGLLAASFVAVAAPERLPEFRHAADLVPEGAGAFYAAEIPEAVYGGIARHDLGDLRVLNGAGEIVPHALLRAPGVERKASAPIALPLFPIYGPPGKSTEDLALRVERKPDGTLSALVAPGTRRSEGRRLLGYVVDAGAATRALRELRFAWSESPEGETVDVRVDASDDLQSWCCTAAGKLVVLRQGELSLERRTLEFAPVKAKYLRVTWRAAREDFTLTGVTAVPVDAGEAARRSWLRVVGTAGAKPGEFAFELPPGLLVDRLRVDLPQENTVAGASVLLQERPGATERLLASAVLYRLQHQGEKLTTPDLELPATAARRWVLRIDPRGGGLGSGMPALQAGYLPHRLVFVARGEGPFRAVFGNADAPSTAQPIQALVPGYSADKPLSTLPARFGPVATRVEPAPGSPEALRAYLEAMDTKKLWLWGSLVAAVLVIVVLGLRLMRQLPVAGERANRPPPYERR